ncbi:hypothetical protein PCC6912_59770 [Chlorogloeopsis fritschii PCC 6912]|uniref:Uncharacterized protein n=1 Tax=Chlorogloeopsis fritschii PCC 6912 TaxID=211165 RepID=A0A3S0ZV48_CHLFR|nr:hypothetical protein PCC6912_59770 [Chlorogloeopsis fritschii PCC 6912]
MLPGNRIEIQAPNLSVGQTVEIVILIPETTISDSSSGEQTLTLEQRLAFLKLPMSERRRILENQAEMMLAHYQQDSEWQELRFNSAVMP